MTYNKFYWLVKEVQSKEGVLQKDIRETLPLTTFTVAADSIMATTKDYKITEEVKQEIIEVVTGKKEIEEETKSELILTEEVKKEIVDTVEEITEETSELPVEGVKKVRGRRKGQGKRNPEDIDKCIY